MIFVGESETRVPGGDYWEAKLEDEGCMRDLVRFLCFVKNLGRLRRDCGLVIRSGGRWGKCGDLLLDSCLSENRTTFVESCSGFSIQSSLGD
ncbi:hypothetical protein Scep_018977 [Stephania cephalantha]|uniref:Uncharacterized protein n=1 Tax=Stephania cephalantha TaxID=152367 RepID=A0AAP0NLQ3_9MAGN